eukprot:TRINITY_DN43283_c0_g1_i1.p1 TRINITY_DN43283_c0_g1~~TRINITY_DN43283_c0_g1_i1.p1  ORF type:complete len:845 (-),score=127.32 TRINITY_DN43283_c0_g1_i1:164-2458(-)
MADFAAKIYSGAGCTGESFDISASLKETRCSNCFDVCDKNFKTSAGAKGVAMFALDKKALSQTRSKVRSLKVSAGFLQAFPGFCHGTYNYGTPNQMSSSVISARQGCVDFTADNAPAHFVAIDKSIRELVAQIYASKEVGPTFEGKLSKSEATELDKAGFFKEDPDKDGELSETEYAKILVQDLAEKNKDNFISISALEDAAATSSATGKLDTNKTKAKIMFGKAYQLAQTDPETDGPQIGPVIVTGGGGGKGDSGKVDDTSIVPGSYDPMNYGTVTMCLDGKTYFYGLCYDYCKWTAPREWYNLCRKTKCDDDYAEIAGGLCKKKGGWSVDVRMKGSYDRGKGASAVDCKLGGSFGPGRQVDDRKWSKEVTMVMFSDPQFPWCSGENKSDIDCALKENFKIVEGMNALGEVPLEWKRGPKEKVKKPAGVFLVGDLTAYGHSWQWEAYKKIYEMKPGWDPKKNLQLPNWPGLGNHDYMNNLAVDDGGCWILNKGKEWPPMKTAACGQYAVSYIRSIVGNCVGQPNKVSTSFGGRVDHYDKSSIAYTVTHSGIRFVHLNNYPTYRRDDLVGVANSMAYVKKEVAHAAKTGEYLVFMFHDIGHHFSDDKNNPQFARYQYFANAVNGSRLLAVFAGHYHQAGGQTHGWLRDVNGDQTTGLRNAWGERIPAMRGYAADARRFLVTEWNVGKCYWRFGAVTVEYEKPAWHRPEALEQQRIFYIPNCKPSVAAPAPSPEAGVVSSSIRPGSVFMRVGLSLFLVAQLFLAF